MTRKLLEMAAEIVQTQAAASPMTSVDITSSLRTVFRTLQEMQKSEAAGAVLARPDMAGEERPGADAAKAIAPHDSITDDKVICLECGAEMRQLTSKHLAGHGMDQSAYRRKYGFTMKTPLAAKSLTKVRIRAARKRGLPENLKAYIEARRQEKAKSSAPDAGQSGPPVQTRLRKKQPT